MHDTPVSALVMLGGRSHSSFVGTRGRGARHGRFQCSYCGKLGHLEDRCWDKHPHLRSTGPPGRGGGRTSTGKGTSSSTATSSQATASMVESPTCSPLYSLNLSKEEYELVLAHRSTPASTNTAAIDSAFSVGDPTSDPVCRESPQQNSSCSARTITNAASQGTNGYGSDFLDLEEAFNRLNRLAVTLPPSTNNSQPFALASFGGGQSVQYPSRGRGRGRGLGGRERLQCTYCGRLGHLEDRCWNKVGLGSRPGPRAITQEGPDVALSSLIFPSFPLFSLPLLRSQHKRERKVAAATLGSTE
ncbi:hypothetical protein EJ110_NYTH16644 [Nymphaea thermarum]|nr:hypothetical protein EJ110_NYTH16644 [Nymphaea thermarum]